MSRNSYLEQVISHQDNVQRKLKNFDDFDIPQPQQVELNIAPTLFGGKPSTTPAASRGIASSIMTGSNQIRIVKYPCLPWQTIIVSPSTWIVHMRKGHTNPLTVSLGTSITFYPRTDSFLVAPSTVQTLMINATTITKEKQGCLVQAYLQYVIQDFSLCYKKVDISDLREPFKIINIQLEEQAISIIKDKVSVMSIDEILTDKRSIIEELTSLLQAVTKMQGIEILQVQIKEAVVSSTSLFESLQKPFREEKNRIARIASLEAKRAIEEAEIEARTKTEKLKRINEVETAMERSKLEGARVEAEMKQIAAQRELDKARSEAELERVKGDLERKKLEQANQNELQLETLKVKEVEMKLANTISEAKLQELLIRSLPEIMSKLPKSDKTEIVQYSSDGNRHHDGIDVLKSVLFGLRELWRTSSTAATTSTGNKQ
jgi:flotillin